ncbi:MAG: hypothetical protein WC595_00145 [Candidatus Nanoarchaeia archaeon]
MRKRGQITIYVLLGLIILGLVMASYYFLNFNPFKTNPNEYDSLTLSLNDCFTRITEQGILLIGMQGGYYSPPSSSSRYYSFSIPAYFSKNITKTPSVEQIEKQLSSYLVDHVPLCIAKLEENPSAFSFNTSKATATVTIQEQTMLVKINHNIRASTNVSTIKLTPYQQEIPFNFKEKYEIVNLIIDEQRKDANAAPIGYLTSIATEKAFTFDTLSLNNNTLFYLLYFNSTLQGGEPFRYGFVVTYDWN